MERLEVQSRISHSKADYPHQMNRRKDRRRNIHAGELRTRRNGLLLPTAWLGLEPKLQRCPTGWSRSVHSLVFVWGVCQIPADRTGSSLPPFDIELSPHLSTASPEMESGWLGGRFPRADFLEGFSEAVLNWSDDGLRREQSSSDFRTARAASSLLNRFPSSTGRPWHPVG